MKTYFWILAGVYWVFFIVASLDLFTSAAENARDIFFWRVITFITLGYLAGIYERSER